MQRNISHLFKKASITVITASLSLVGAYAQSASTTTSGSANESSTQTSTKADEKTTHFLKEAARINDDEIAMAELGARKAQNADLKSFCQQMQQDHTQANEQLRPIAQKYGVSLDQSLPKHQDRQLTKLEKESSGAQLDQKLATDMLKAHEKAIARFEKAANSLTEPDVKQFAQTMLPKLQQHFTKAETVAREVGVSQSTISSLSKKLPAGVGGTSEMPESQQGSGSSKLQQGSSSSQQ